MAKKKKKLSTAEIMKVIIDEDLLSERRKNSSQKEKFEVVEEVVEEKKEYKWFEIPIKKSDFVIKEHDSKFYARHKEWKKNIWIGAYESEKEVEDVIKSYVKETKKPPIERKFINIHSILIEL